MIYLLPSKGKISYDEKSKGGVCVSELWWIIPILASFVGVLVGGLLVYVLLKGQQKFLKEQQLQQLEKKQVEKEIQIYLLLNAKINEILMKRQPNLPLYVGFDHFKDTFIDIEDYVYLQSFIAKNYAELPQEVTEKFLTELAARKIVLMPDETVQIGGYAFKNGRGVMERLSEDLLQQVAEKKRM